MFNKKLKNKIEKLEQELKNLEQKYVKDEKSGFLILREDSGERKLRKKFRDHCFFY